jgi:hypothetical protein
MRFSTFLNLLFTREIWRRRITADLLSSMQQLKKLMSSLMNVENKNRG